MAFGLSKNTSNRKRRDQIVSIDLGGRITKAAVIQRKGNGFALANYALLDAPIFEKDPSVDLLTEHFKQIAQALDVKIKLVAVSLGVNESIVRHVEMPSMPLADMRLVLRNNGRMYLQQDLAGHIFDVAVTSRPSQDKQLAQQKNKILVAGAERDLLNNILMAGKNAGWVVDHIIPGMIGPLNAFEAAMPAEFGSQAVALVDIGYKSSTICLMNAGEVVMSRVIAIGGDKFTTGLSEAMNISYAEAESIKIGMPTEVQSNLEPLIVPLGRELRASVDFFEHQQDKPVSCVYLSGGSASSDFILEILQQELMKECKTWNPITPFQMTLPPQKNAELEHVGRQLAVAVGGALTAM